MVPAGTVTQPLLIPISIAGQVAGQQGLAVWTFPTATVAALPGLTAASPSGGIFKPPIANLQGNRRSPPRRPLSIRPAEPTPSSPGGLRSGVLIFGALVGGSPSAKGAGSVGGEA